MIYKITPLADCKACHGSGTVYDIVDYGSTTAELPSGCSCVDEQLPEEFDDSIDEIEIVDNSWQGGDGPEFDEELDKC